MLSLDGSTVGTYFYICEAFTKTTSQKLKLICLCFAYLLRFVSIIRKNKQYYIYIGGFLYPYIL